MNEQSLSKPNPKKGRLGLYLIITALVAGGGFFSYQHFANKSAAPQSGRAGNMPPDSQPIQAAAVVRADQPVYFNGLGTVTAAATATVQVSVGGVLQKLHFTEGQQVKAGQLLAEIDPRPFQVQLAQAQGTLAKDQALLASARRDLERYKTLLSQDSIAAQQVDTQATLVKQYEGTVQVDQAQVANAQLQLTYSRVVAPISGRTGISPIDVGNIITPSNTAGITVITQDTPINVIFNLPENQLHRVMRAIKEGKTLEAEAWSRDMGRKIADGTLITVDNLIDTATGTVRLKASFPNEDRRLFPNQFVNVRLKVGTEEGVLLAPISAVQKGSKGSFVWVVTKAKPKTEQSAPVSSDASKPVADGQSAAHAGNRGRGQSGAGADNAGKGQMVTMRIVKTGTSNGDKVVITEGVEEGDLLVTDGVDRLREGAKVEVVDPKKVLEEAASAPKASSGRGRRGGP